MVIIEKIDRNGKVIQVDRIELPEAQQQHEDDDRLIVEFLDGTLPTNNLDDLTTVVRAVTRHLFSL